uniref:HDC16555 n=1 Tax=Drosophila melanogaster TaxID=7227 RepID=Q6IIY7_DROME|nr:TPA_inf: HDC16555 [Drosophila melanogaster]
MALSLPAGIRNSPKLAPKVPPAPLRSRNTIHTRGPPQKQVPPGGSARRLQVDARPVAVGPSHVTHAAAELLSFGSDRNSHRVWASVSAAVGFIGRFGPLDRLANCKLGGLHSAVVIDGLQLLRKL